jgi:NTE family protein
MQSSIQTPAAGSNGPLGLVLAGGGARGAYQAGVLKWLAERHPDLEVPIITGVSAGAVNTACIAAHADGFRAGVDRLHRLWADLTVERVFRVDARSVGTHVMGWGVRLMSGGTRRTTRQAHGLLDTSPLRDYLHAVLGVEGSVITGIGRNVAEGKLKAAAIVATSYSTNQTVVFLEGSDILPWTRPQRRAEKTRLTVDHIMASTALPLFFPAIRIGSEWFGDGGIRMAAPLSPALHLGASHVLAISTRYAPTRAESAVPTIPGYPPPAQVLGSLLNAVFLDLIDQDALRLQRINELLGKLPPERRDGMRLINFLGIRPSRDLGRLAAEFEPAMPRAFRFMTRGLGTQEQMSPDMLSLLMFQHDYIKRLIEIGERDTAARADEIDAFLAPLLPATRSVP